MSSLPEVVASKRAVIFDLFHTLTALELTSAREIPSDRELIGASREEWSRQLVALAQVRWTGGLATPAAVVRALVHAIDPTVAEQRLQEVLINRQRRFAIGLREMPAESLTVLKALKQRGHKLALLSNADVLEAASWSECPAAGLFDVTIFSCEVGLAKPDPAIYRHCLQPLKVEPAEALFVGDGGSEELRGAKQVGLTTVMMAGIVRRFWPELIEERRPAADFEIDRLSELT